MKDVRNVLEDNNQGFECLHVGDVAFVEIGSGCPTILALGFLAHLGASHQREGLARRPADDPFWSWPFWPIRAQAKPLSCERC